MRAAPGRNGSRRSIRGWLTLLGTGSAAIALLGASVGFVALESIQGRRAVELEVSLLADVVAANSVAALSFLDATAAHEALASLQADPRLRLACLYDAAGVLFTAYAPEQGPAGPGCPAAAARPGHAGARLRVVHPIRIGQETLGSLLLEVETEPLLALLLRHAGVAVPVMLLSALAASLFAVPVQRRIAGPLHALLESSRALARGELTTVPAGGGAHEVDALSRAFGEMASALRNLVGRVRGNAAAVSQAVTSLREASQQMAGDARSQSNAVTASTDSMERIADSIHDVEASTDLLLSGAEETARSLRVMDDTIGAIGGHADGLASEVETTASSVAQLTESIESIALGLEGLKGAAESTVGSISELRITVEGVRGSAEQSEALSAQAVDEAERGRGAVSDTVRRMQEIRVSFREIEDVVTRVSGQSQSIGSIVDLIEGVSDQTRLVALNASIIAAQAGEHGKAFGVVAQQVGELAESTTGSARKIADLVKELQDGARAAVAFVETGAQRVESGVESSEEAGEVLAAIAGSARRCSEVATAIARATESQANDLGRLERGAAEAEQTTDRIAQATGEQRVASAGIRDTTERLRASARDLNRLAGEQRTESRRVEQVRQGITSIAETTRGQQDEGERIKAALGVFRAGAGQALERASQLEAIVSVLGSRSDDLEEAVSRFGATGAGSDESSAEPTGRPRGGGDPPSREPAKGRTQPQVPGWRSEGA